MTPWPSARQSRSSVLAYLRLVLVGVHLFYATVQVALFFPFLGHSQRDRLKRAWSRQLLRLLGIRIDSNPQTAQALDAIEGGLLVCNHISFIDIFVINTLLPSGFVAKNEVSRWPLIGWLVVHGGTVFIQRGSRLAVRRTQQQLLDALHGGQRFVIFPEGTSTAGDRVLPFHSALFQSAVSAQVSLHALAISYHQADGSRSVAPAYIDDISLMDCLLGVVKTRGITVRLRLAASYAPPHPDRRRLAHDAHLAVVAALSR